ncbi:hypothetical protein [Alicyclobacillus sp. ALC3]|uniref:hypothetical protein n=1 Tax=Alicyclobacillus sp. ALC3 TaxID=2796143 RepID=UPI002379453F|nr:hypothetical protein [Alicyclobacillus sp. ALC3]WDL98507.1 hypothetical protein JC200_07455 [Alicyclobacillus sp. ALC3]
MGTDSTSDNSLRNQDDYKGRLCRELTEKVHQAAHEIKVSCLEEEAKQAEIKKAVRGYVRRRKAETQNFVASIQAPDPTREALIRQLEQATTSGDLDKIQGILQQLRNLV